MFIIGLTRVRNESLILQDTLDHLSKWVDGIIVYDDASCDNTVSIAQSHPKVIKVIQNKNWSKNRESAESSHRQQLLEAGKEFHPEWFWYFDADERFEGDFVPYLQSLNKNVNGVRISLFDAYLTKNDSVSYKSGDLFNFRKIFGVECRKILMIFRNKSEVKFCGLDAREPRVLGKLQTYGFCQHYGKALSIDHWEETCHYYATYFPKYSDKWKQRFGKAIHMVSDFGTKLYDWDGVKKNSVVIYEAGEVKKQYIHPLLRWRSSLVGQALKRGIKRLKMWVRMVYLN